MDNRLIFRYHPGTDHGELMRVLVVSAAGMSVGDSSDGVTQEGRPSGDWKSLSKGVGGSPGKSGLR